MQKRYQVFISSTFIDLQNARQEVSQALLRASCFPAGMELFPATDSEQFDFIKSVIDQSDYYILISAGRYGSLHPETGLSFTEMEYDYALATDKPIIRLLHKDPFNLLKGEFIEKTDTGRQKLEAFRAKLASGSLVRYWSDPRDLMAETVFALQDIQLRKPATGWVRSDRIMSDEAELELAQLRQKVAELELQNARLPERWIDVLDVFKDIDGETSVQFSGQCPAGLSCYPAEMLDNNRKLIKIPHSALCWALATAMTVNFVQGEIAEESLQILSAREDGFWEKKDFHPLIDQAGLRRAFAFLRERHVAKPEVVAGFTETRGDGFIQRGPIFSKRTTWSLTDAAAVSSSSWYLRMTERR
ncbi:DUF4062 domain-containing protein [Rhodobacter capsulatus]|uniref:DUF4062 domain-containing protein n=1 Tax=Rhodobacter capsulatus TaxID=1061 RepID=UPI004029977B